MSRPIVWLFDLDDTLHDASRAAVPHMIREMTAYIAQMLAVTEVEANALRDHYWRRYGATLLGMVRHHGVAAQHFLHHTHRLPGLEDRVRGHARDLAALARLPGRKYVLTNAPAAYAARVLGVLFPRGPGRTFDGVIAAEGMRMFGQLRLKPDARMLRRLAARLAVPPSRCVLVEDTAVHLKAARRTGMRTVWMQRFVRRHLDGEARPGRVRATAVPAYVDRRITALSRLRR